jgi:preprotein translocase subunit SecD
MPNVRASVLVALLAVLAGCSDVASLGADPVVVEVDVAAAEGAQVAAMERVLHARLDTLRSSTFSSLTSSIRGNTIVLRFEREPLARAAIEPLVTARGELRVHRVALPDGAWYTDADVEDAAVVATESGHALEITLSEQRGRQVQSLSTRWIGETVAVVWDGEVLTTANVAGPFGRHIQLTTDDLQQAQAMAAILESGRLPARVAGYRIDGTE